MGVSRARATVNLAAIERNCGRLRSRLVDGASLCAVVKADGYGHGAVPSARAALAGGATWLAVATAPEARELRLAGLREQRLLVMGALDDVELAQALEADADVVVWSEAGVRAVAAAGGGAVHVKLDSGMGRLGTRDLDEASRVALLAEATAGVRLAGAMTHFATADDRDDAGFFERQLRAFTNWVAPLKATRPQMVVHAANSAALLRDARAHFDMARCGIAIYGLDPANSHPPAAGLEPALALSSYVADVKLCARGQSSGYGRRFVASRDTYLGMLPIGYGDGWRRGLSNRAAVLIGGRRHALVGTVSMDNVAVDLGPDPGALALSGAEAVLIGAQGEERIAAEEVAAQLDTINYEVTCALSARASREHHRDGVPASGATPPTGGAEGRSPPAGRA
jgi:alanine racemase